MLYLATTIRETAVSFCAAVHGAEITETTINGTPVYFVHPKED